MRNGFNHIDKLDFLKAYSAAHRLVFTASNIQSGFAGAGILPFQRQTVLEKLNIQLTTSTPPSSRGSASSTLATLHTVYQLRKQASSIRKLLKNGS